MTIAVKQLFTHPVKGLTPQAENQVYLQAGHGIVGDRAFALMFDRSTGEHSSSVVPWMKKKNFAMQCDFPALAALECDYDSQRAVLTINRQGVELLIAPTNTTAGRSTISAFFTDYLAAIAADKPPLRLVGDSSGVTRYPDRYAVHLSLLSQETIDHLSIVAQQPIDVRRFRPNIVLAGVPAWEEFAWVGQKVQLGTAQLEITAPINRCLNIDVNPDTGIRDLPLLSLLQQHFNHKQTGVLAQVIVSGSVDVGAELKILN